MKKDRREEYKEYYRKNRKRYIEHHKKRRASGKHKIDQQLQYKRLARRRYWLSKYKQLKGCCICKYNKYGCSLDFDHIDPKIKLFEITREIGRSLKNLFKEIRKCRILCANCHRSKDFSPILLMT